MRGGGDSEKHSAAPPAARELTPIAPNNGYSWESGRPLRNWAEGTGEYPYRALAEPSASDPKPSVALFRSAARSVQKTVVRESGREFPAPG
jgi:hypothetical protein